MELHKNTSARSEGVWRESSLAGVGDDCALWELGCGQLPFAAVGSLSPVATLEMPGPPEQGNQPPTVNSEQLWNNPKQALNLALDLVLLSGLSLESHSLKRHLGGQGERAEAMGATD